MSTSAPTFSQIKAQVAAIRRKIPDARVIGIRAPGRWTGERWKQDGAETYLIEQCDSPLAMRIALREEVDDRTVKVLVTSLDDTDLEDDVLVRLARRRLFPIDNWQIVRSLFQAQHIDPRLTRHRWIAEYLLEDISTEDCPPAAGGFLDAETVWQILLNRRIGLAAERPDLATLLKWSIDAGNVQRFRQLPAELREAAAAWLSGWAGSAARTVLDCVVANDRPDALPIGLATGVVFHPRAAGRLDKAAGKMEERYLGGAAPGEAVLHEWHRAATEVVRLQLADPNQKRQQLHRADEILHEVGAEAFAHLSDTSPLGFDQRLAACGRCLLEALKARSPASLEPLAEARRAAASHDLGTREHHRLQRFDMALRLVAWLGAMRSGGPGQPRSLAEAVAYQVGEGGFVDWARLSLRTGDPVRELSEAYARLGEAIRTIREQQSRQFAILLRDWTAAGSTGGGIVPVEKLLDTLVAPLVAQAPVLLIVVDGMSVAVCRELLGDDKIRHDWVLLCEQESPPALSAALAAIPSVTEVSRTSLLSGRLRQGTADHEKVGFSQHPALRRHCRSGFPPVLFHKPALQETDDASLAAEVREAIGSPQRRIVGVVVNAVDDHLLKSEQINTRWSRDEIRVLPALLHEAKQARRLVLLLSDHGHILDCGAQVRSSEGGERWRVDKSAPATDELRIRGARVILPESGSLIAPWSEKVRYGWKRNGYHGGLTPQEMVAPIAVLCPTGTYPRGWVEAPVDTPAWWDELRVEQPEGVHGLRPPTAKTTPPGLLFDPDTLQETTVEAVSESSRQPLADWITRLLSSPIFEEQSKRAAKAAPANEALGRLLNVLDSCGGKMSAGALARALAYPPNRLSELLAAAERILNIDGYPVLARDDRSDTIELHRDLLVNQFDLT